MIPFLDLRLAYRELGDAIDAATQRVLRSGWFILGPETERFEAEFANFCEARFAIGVGNGLDALVLSLRALGIGPGDEVITSGHTFVATWIAIEQVGATVVPVEPTLDGYGIDTDLVAAKITGRTRAILPVHLYGTPIDLNRLLAIGEQYGLPVIEDAAQAHGARLDGKRIGGGATMACWSFYPSKNLGAMGDGGAVTTNNEELAERVRLLRNYGAQMKYDSVPHGVNSRLDPLQAAILSVKLEHLDEWNDRRRAIAAIYDRELYGTELGLPATPDRTEPVWHLYVVTTSKRDALRNVLSQAGIETGLHYPLAPHDQKRFAHLRDAYGGLPRSRTLADTVLSLPIGPHLPEEDAYRVAETVKTALRGI